MILPICLTAFCAALLTFFSGFGLGTILMPVFAIFFSIQEAIALTAIVHFLNNIFKVTLVGKHAKMSVLLRFGITAMIFSFLGAKLLAFTSNIAVIHQYSISDKIFEIMPAKLLIAILIFSFTLIELIPRLNLLSINPKYLALGGAISGFFGGFSGHQGALRTMFLSKLKLSKQAFIGTGVVIALLIDLMRLAAYSTDFEKVSLNENFPLLSLATLSALLGTWLGNKTLKKITMNSVQKIVAVSLLLFSIALGAGWI